MFFTVVLLLMVVEVPLSFKSLVSFTVSLLFKTLSLASFTYVGLFFDKDKG